MQFDANCIACLIQRQYGFASKAPNDAASRAFMKDVLQTVLDAPDGVSAPYLVPGFAAAAKKHLHISDAYADIKRQSNERVLAMLPRIRAMVAAADDPLEMALKFSRTGNLLDFAVLPREKIDAELEAAVAQTPEQPLDQTEYAALRRDLQAARSMLILGDNAGEIGFDRVLVEQLQAQFPALTVQYVVRGGNAQNDATREDAHAVGMDTLVNILDNGSTIPGTELAYCGRPLLDAIASADLLLAKGQANFESLLGCGHNVYYLLLCKCRRLSELLHQPLMQGLLLNDRRIRLD